MAITNNTALANFKNRRAILKTLAAAGTVLGAASPVLKAQTPTAVDVLQCEFSASVYELFGR